MKRIISIISFCIVLSFMSCDDAHSIISGGIRYVNDTCHVITIKDYMIAYTHYYNAELSPGEDKVIVGVSAETNLWTDDSLQYSCSNKLPLSVTVIFDNKYSVTYKRDSEGFDDMLCLYESYTYKRIRKNAGELIYTFTEKDYEYAREFGKKIE